MWKTILVAGAGFAVGMFIWTIVGQPAAAKVQGAISGK